MGKALQEKYRRQNILGAMGFYDSATQVDVNSTNDTSDISVLYDMAIQVVFLTQFSPIRVDNTYDNGFCTSSTQALVLAPPSPSPPPPPVSNTPTAPPKYAGDALLTTSGQNLLTELVPSGVVGGAISVKLKSWQTRVILKMSRILNDYGGTTSSSI